MSRSALPLLAGALALALRLLHLAFSSKLLLADDAEFFEQHAKEFLAAWHAFGAAAWWPSLRHAVDESSLQGPLYPFFESLVYLAVGGVSHLALAVVQALLGSVMVALTCLTARRAFGTAAGLIAGLLAAIYAPLIASTGQLLAESLLTFVQALALYLLVRGLAPGRWRARLLGGVCIGLLMLRPAFQYSGLLLLLGMGAAAVAQGAIVCGAVGNAAGENSFRSKLFGSAGQRRGLKPPATPAKPPEGGSWSIPHRQGAEAPCAVVAGAFMPRRGRQLVARAIALTVPYLAGVLVVAAPWVLMNGLVFGQFVWSRTGDAWHQVYWGIYPPNHGWWPPDSPVPPRYGVESLPGARSAGAVIEERDLDYLQAAIDQVRATPLKAAATEVNKLYQGYLHPSDTYGERPPLVGWAAVPLHRAMLLLALGGLCFGWIRPRDRAPWLILTAGLLASALPFLASHVDLRYTIPPSQIVSIFAGAALVWTWRAVTTLGSDGQTHSVRALGVATAIVGVPFAVWATDVPLLLSWAPTFSPWALHLVHTAAMCVAFLLAGAGASMLLRAGIPHRQAAPSIMAGLLLGAVLAGIYGAEALYEGDWHQWTAQLRPGDSVRQTFALPAGWQPPAGGRAEVRLYVAGTRDPDYEPVVKVNGQEVARLGPALSAAGPLRFWEKIMVAARNQGKTRAEVAQWIAVPVDYAALARERIDVELAITTAGDAAFPKARLTIWGDYPPRPGARLYEGPAVYSRIQGQDEAFLKYVATGEYGIWRWQTLHSVGAEAACQNCFVRSHFDVPHVGEWRSDDLSASAGGRQTGEYRIRLLVYGPNGALAAIF